MNATAADTFNRSPPATNHQSSIIIIQEEPSYIYVPATTTTTTTSLHQVLQWIASVLGSLGLVRKKEKNLHHHAHSCTNYGLLQSFPVIHAEIRYS